MQKNSTYGGLSFEAVVDLELKVKGKLGELNKTSRVLKEEVFTILSDHSTLLQYPIEDDDFCALVCYKRDRYFSIINTYIPYDKQIFAAAHELYHIWYDQDFLKNGEILKRQVVDAQLESSEVEMRERMANRFAAMLLVPTETLQKELDYLRVTRYTIELSHIVRLMDTFGVPYKTMVRRLQEVEFISPEQCAHFLRIPDRDENDGVLLLQKKMQVGLYLQKRTKEYRFGNMVAHATTAFEQNLISFKKLQDLLGYVRMTPEHVVQVPKEYRRISDEELAALLEDEED